VVKEFRGKIITKENLSFRTKNEPYGRGKV
jgi:hypothetical protein